MSDHKLQVCDRCGWYAGIGHHEFCDSVRGAAAKSLSARVVVPSTQLGYGLYSLAFLFDQEASSLCMRVNPDQTYTVERFHFPRSLTLRQAALLVDAMGDAMQRMELDDSEPAALTPAPHAQGDTLVKPMANPALVPCTNLPFDVGGKGTITMSIDNGRFTLDPFLIDGNMNQRAACSFVEELGELLIKHRLEIRSALPDTPKKP